MPRPTTRNALLEAIETERNTLEQLLAGLSPGQMIEPGLVGAWSVKDVLAHLLEWEQMVLNWHAAGLKGKVPVTPADGFNWAQLPQLNQQIFEKHRDRSLADIQKEFEASYRKILKTIQSLSNEDLFTRGRFAWTRNNTLGAYFISSTSSHYQWARTTLKKALKAKSVK
ncbi:MAG TPA: ClbS/DfsB family four-helix bundle protein [Anaerolineales bacterium]|nr:ClbS/DfsB family four-helix bundle protein [Anaerolineales bacterium]